MARTLACDWHDLLKPKAVPQRPIPLRPIGAHAPVTGGLATGSLRYAAAVRAEAIQVFVTNPRAWATVTGDDGPVSIGYARYSRLYPTLISIRIVIYCCRDTPAGAARTMLGNVRDVAIGVDVS